MIAEKEIANYIKTHPEMGLKLAFDHFSDYCYNVCYRYVNQNELAEEMVMNCFTKAYQNFDKFEYQKEGSLKAWLKTIAINECLMALRKDKKMKEIMADDTEITDIGFQSNHLAYNDILKALNQLPIALKTVFNLFEIEGYSHKEIAQKLGCTEGNSKSSLSRAKSKLRQLLPIYGFN
ncbi:MAG: sigma-70 family RNA polymerase sigma factor [Flavobacteriales bacterium]|nr:sigma-70 family RNA polymerase sigma factor [Flavobacteriales bacterium]